MFTRTLNLFSTSFLPETRAAPRTYATQCQLRRHSPPPPIDILEIDVLPDDLTPGNVPYGFVQMEDQIHRAYLVPAFLVESLKAAARTNAVKESVVDEVVEVRSSVYCVVLAVHFDHRSRPSPRNTRRSLKDSFLILHFGKHSFYLLCKSSFSPQPKPYREREAMALNADIRHLMERYAISFQEAARRLFESEMLTLNHNKESYTTFSTLSSQLDLILNNDYVDGMAYIERKHREEQSSDDEEMEVEEPEPTPPPPPTKGKGKRRDGAVSADQVKKRRM